MKILHLSTEDEFGGASKAAYRLHQGLKKIGVESWMLVKNKSTDDPNIIGGRGEIWKVYSFLEKQIDKIPTRLHFKNKNIPFSNGFVSSQDVIKRIKRINPEIIHIHWINNGFISITQLKKIFELGRPIVITLHDSWFFTGGCHIPQSCEKYRKWCGNCPLLGSSKEDDLSRLNWKRKERVYKNNSITIVAPSKWMQSCVKQSSLLKDKNISCIPNAIDVDIFKPLDKEILREKWKLDKNKKYLLFGAVNALTDPNKGFYLFKKALQDIKILNCELIVFGSNKEKHIDVSIPCINLGYINNQEDLVEIYSIADVFVGPSLQESFGQTLLEAMSCGTPCVAFDNSGPGDFITHKKDGYLAKPFETEDLVRGIEFCLWTKGLGTSSRNKVINNYSIKSIAQEYLNLYQSLQ